MVTMTTSTNPLDGITAVEQVSYPVVEITPELAAQWLERNVQNRTLRQHKVDTYAAAMLRGEWRESREPIEFGENGDLINGQHRLSAVIKSSVTIRNPVRTDVPKSEMAVIDTGLSRKASDVLKLSGHHNATALAAMAKAWYLWHHVPSLTMLRSGSKVINNELTLKLVEDHPDMIHSVEFINKVRPQFNLVPPAAMMAVHYEITQKHGIAHANQFFRELAEGFGLEEGSPILALRNVLIKSSTSVTKRSTEERMAWLIIGFNKWHAGEKNVKLIKFVSKSPFPNIAAY